MADVDFDEFDGGYAEQGAGFESGRARNLINISGAVCSVALVIGLAVWGYKLAVRDVSGIPVVRALEGPLRIAPENPGGDVASHQGLSVNAVAAAGTALPLPDKLILAPKEGTLAEEDQAGTAELAPLPESLAMNVDPSLGAVAEVTAPELALVEIVPEELAPAADPALDAGSLAVTEPLPATQEDAVAAALAAALADGGETSASDAPEIASAASLRPRTRPANRSAAPVAAAEPATASVAADDVVTAVTTEVPAQPAVVTEIDPANIAEGTRLVQLGAFDDADSARAAWSQLQTDFPDLLPGKAMVVQSAQSGGRTFYRLRAQGFDGEDAARSFCATMLAQNASCIPVVQK